MVLGSGNDLVLFVVVFEVEAKSSMEDLRRGN